MAEGIQSAKAWWQGTSLSKNLNKAAAGINKAWKNSSIGKKVTATVDKVNKAAQNIKDKWDNSSIGQFCNKAKTSVTNFYEKHKTVINLVAGAAVIAACGIAMLTGPVGCCITAVALKGAFWESVGGAVSGAIGGGINSAISYMEEHGTLDGAGKKIMEGVATGFSSGAFSGAISGYIGGRVAYKKNPNGYCFVAGTAVLTLLGYTGIECIRAGDYVYAKNEETGKQEYMPVLDTFTNEVTEICTLTIDGETIETTVGHPFYSVENGWINAGDLSEGDTVELSDGSSGTVESVEITQLDEPVTVYNFCVMDFHTYYVGENEVLVHNKPCNSTSKTQDSSPSKSGSSTKPYANSRPSYGKNQADEVWENAKDPITGKVYDPSSVEITWDKTKPRNGQWDMGHIPGEKYSEMHQLYMDDVISKDEFLNWYRNPQNYRPELPSTNRSHKYE